MIPHKLCHYLACLKFHSLTYYVMLFPHESCHSFTNHVIPLQIMSFLQKSWHCVTNHDIPSIVFPSNFIIPLPVIQFPRMSCHSLARHDFSFPRMSCHFLKFHLIPSYVTSNPRMLCHSLACHAILSHVMSFPHPRSGWCGNPLRVGDFYRMEFFLAKNKSRFSSTLNPSLLGTSCPSPAGERRREE